MKNAASIKCNKMDSPKTPGGISKSLLTPCRRVGLSRNWKRPGSSPFISPITNSNTTTKETKVEKKESRKRKERIPDDDNEDKVEEKDIKTTPEDGATEAVQTLPFEKHDDLQGTPVRLELPRKKSKLIKTLSSDKCSKIDQIKEVNKDEDVIENTNTDVQNIPAEPVSTPSRKKSRSKKESFPKIVNETHEDITTTVPSQLELENKTSHAIDSEFKNDNEENSVNKNKEKHSPKELTKKCIVVIQKKVFKTDKPKLESKKISKPKDPRSQTLFESDSDDLPLCNLSKKANEKVAIENDKPCKDLKENNQANMILADDTDFLVKKLEHKITSTNLSKSKDKKSKLKEIPIPRQIDTNVVSQTSFDEDDDFDYTNKKTILIRKTYEKVTKPSKAKSTGSVTQRDIDDLKARIEMKKKLLVAKAMTEDTEELRGLIKKWQKGCQDALVELLELMKTKFPDRHNMDFSEMLQMLRIPANLVGYDSDNDCFNTPEDSDIILSKFNDM